MARVHDVLKEDTWFMPMYIPKEKRPTFESFKKMVGSDGILIHRGRVSNSPNDELGAEYRFPDVVVPCQVCGNPYHTEKCIVIVDENQKVSGYFAVCKACDTDRYNRTRPIPLTREQTVAALLEGTEIPRYMLGSRFSNFDSRNISNGETIVNKIKAFSKIGTHNDLILVFLGSTGTGKTHLAVSGMYQYLFEDTHKLTGYVKASSLLQEIKESIGLKKGIESVMKKYISIDFLFIDEISKSLVSKFSTDTFQDIVQARIEYGVKTILAGNIDAPLLPELLGEAVLSRIKGVGGILTFNGPDYRAANGIL